MRTRFVPAAAAVATLVTLGTGAAPAQADTTPRAGCPGGAVCMYVGDGYAKNTPQHIWRTYGFHALHNEFGQRIVLNNQYATSAGRAGAYTCVSTNPSTCHLIEMDTYDVVDITPINYIRLTASGG